MHIGETTRISGPCPIDNVCFCMVGILIKIVGMACDHYLIGLLEILFIHKVICYLGREGVESDPFQMVCQSQITRYLHHLFQ